jgi:hypothetical protein
MLRGGGKAAAAGGEWRWLWNLDGIRNPLFPSPEDSQPSDLL